MVPEGRGLLVGWRPHAPVFGEAAPWPAGASWWFLTRGWRGGSGRRKCPPSFLTERHSLYKQRDENAAQSKTGKCASVSPPPARTAGPPLGLRLPAVVSVLSLFAFPTRTRRPAGTLGRSCLVTQISLSTYCVLLLPRALWVPSSVWGEMLPELPCGPLPRGMVHGHFPSLGLACAVTASPPRRMTADVAVASPGGSRSSLGPPPLLRNHRGLGGS